jgi:hypothetical protein
LSDAARRREGWLRIKNLTKGAYATFIETFVEAVEKPKPERRIAGVGSSPCVEKGADKPCPYGGGKPRELIQLFLVIGVRTCWRSVF